MSWSIGKVFTHPSPAPRREVSMVLISHQARTLQPQEFTPIGWGSSLLRPFQGLLEVRWRPTEIYRQGTIHQGKESRGYLAQWPFLGVLPACCMSSAVGELGGGEAPNRIRTEFLGNPAIFLPGSLGCMFKCCLGLTSLVPF